MDDMNEIFSRATDADLDTELAAAGELLQKIAQQEGIDLSQLSDEDVAELMVDLLPKTAADEGEHESAREESGDRKKEKKKEEAKMASEITFADVAVELNKVAASEGIDLDGLSREQYHELFDIVAESMQDPDYMENKLAQDEANAKLAEADALGRYMAHAFMNELGEEKIARRREMPNLTEEEIAKLPANQQDFIRSETARRNKPNVAPTANPTFERSQLPKPSTQVNPELMARRNARVAGESVAQKGGKYFDRLGRALGGATPRSRAIRAAAAVTGGTLAAGGAAYGAKKLMDKKSLDEQALEMARDYLLENGIDPDTGYKLASDDDVAQRAAEILAEAGWL